MLDAFKRLFRRDPAPAWPEVERWAQERQYQHRRTRDGAGFVIEGHYEGRPWRMEWGPSQRAYIEGQELRLRMELDLPPQLQLLLLPRELMKLLESETFERYTDHLKTQIDASTPEEMRWLVMHPKLSLRALPALHGRVGAVGNSLAALGGWLQGPLAEALERATPWLMVARRPWVLLISRQRVMLRLQQADPRLEVIETSLALFEVAVARTPNAVAGLADGSGSWPATGSSSLPSQFAADPEPGE